MRHEAIDKALEGLEPAAADAIKTSILGGDSGPIPSGTSFLGDAPAPAVEVPSVKSTPRPTQLLGVDAFSSGDVELLRKSLLEGSPVSVKAGSSATVIADLIPQVPTDASTVTSYSINAAATAAAPVAEGGSKAESDPEWAAVTHPVEKIAHFATVSTELLSDVAGFQQIIGEELFGGLQLAESNQLLNGTGTTPQLEGILQNSGIQAQAGAGTDIDELLAAITLLRVNAFVEPDAIVMHPTDWNSSELATAKDTTDAYLAGRPFDSGPATVWGVPVVLSTQIATGTALVGDFADGARIYVREVPRLMADPYTLATSNQVRLIAEQRLALAVLRPKNFASCVVSTA